MAKTRATRKPARRPKRQRPRSAPPATDEPLTQSPIGDKLSDEMKLFVVQQLAAFDGPLEVAEAVKGKYGVEVTRQAIHYYDPTHEPKPPEKWCQIFKAMRDKYLDDTAEIPARKRSVRIRRLERMALNAEKMRNYQLAGQLYEQIAKEVGELYTNRQKMELTGKDGKPIEVQTDELRNRIVRRITGVASRIGPNTNHSGTDASGPRGA
jgi:hypothetical protein